MSEVTVEEDNRPSVYTEGNVVIYRASAIESHPHALAAHRLGFTPADTPEWLQKRFDEGHLHEDAILAEHEKQYGCTIIDRQREVELWVVPGKVMIRGHIDGREKATLVDAKAFSKDEYARFKRQGVQRFPRYVKQAVIYMKGLNAKCFGFAIKDRNSGEQDYLAYTWDDLNGDEVWAGIVKKILAVEAAVRKGTMPDADDCKDYPCAFFYLHSSNQTTIDEQIEGTVEDALLDALADTFNRAKQRRKEAEEVEKEARERLVGAMGEREKVATGKFKVKQMTVMADRFDQRKHKEAEPLCHERYTYPSGYVRLDVKEV